MPGNAAGWPSSRMLSALRELFDSIVGADAAAGAPRSAGEHTLELAAAVLLVEVMRADGRFDERERAAVVAAIRRQFGLTDDEARRLADAAHVSAAASTDLYGFTSRLDERLSMEDKLRLIELMWRVAYADAELAAHERHVMWRIADLLHVPPGAYQHARLRAQRGGDDNSPI
jgi:uncharacterized tellurite resistance protein B-like protein